MPTLPASLPPWPAGLLDAITSGGAVGSAAVADAANRTQALVDALRALPDSVADISASVQGAVALLRDNFKDVRRHAALRCAALASGAPVALW